MPRVEIIGTKRLQRAIDRVTAEVEHKGIDDSVRGAAKIIHTEERALVPFRSGRLYRALKWLVVKRNKGEIEADVGPDSRQGFYATFLEFGTRYITAKPFARPAFDQSLPAAQSFVRATLTKAVRRGSRA